MKTTIARFILCVAGIACLATPLYANGYTFNGDLTIPVFDWPYNMTAFDMQGDGGQDFLCFEAGNYNPVIALNRHDSTFTMETKYVYDRYDTHYSNGVAHGDVNGDTYEDLIVGLDSDSLGDVVMIWLNDGSGLYTPDTSYEVSLGPNVVLYEDFDGDTYKDIMICTSGLLNLLPNLGDGTFDTAIPITAGIGWVYCMEAIDVDNDTDMDVVYGLDGRDSVRIKYNDGSGNFDSTVTMPTGDRPYYMASGFFNDDAYTDFVIGNYYENTISVFINNGDGTFADSVNYANTVPVRCIDVADLDNDGRPEILTSSRNNNQVSVYPNNGDGTFGTRQDYYFYYPTEIMGHDMDGDGNTDILIGSTEGFVVLKYGDGTLAIGDDNSGDIEAGRRISNIASADFDGNGTMDLVSVGRVSNDISVFLNNGDSTFISGGTVAAGTAPFAITTADFDQANGIDIAVTNRDSDNITVFLNDGSGNFTSGTSYVSNDEPVAIGAGLFSDDAYPDLIVTCYYSDSMSIYHNNGDGTFAAKIDYETEPEPLAIAIGDHDGGGTTDVMVGTQYGVQVFPGDGGGFFGAPNLRETYDAIREIWLADFDGDSDMDILTLSDDSMLTMTFLNDGSGYHPDSFTVLNNNRRYMSSLDVADIDQDGDLDLAFGYESDYFINVMSNRGDGSFEYPVSYAMPHYAAPACLTDLNGDSYPELVTATTHYSSADNDSIFIFWNNQEAFPLDVDDDPANLPAQFALAQNYPNPFNPATAIDFSLERQTNVRIEVFNILGQSLRTLINEEKPAGDHTIYWDGKDNTGQTVASGIYFYRMVAGDYSMTRKMLLLK